MSLTHLIKETLDILDLNITFEGNCLTKEKYKGQICAIYRGKLSYSPQKCIHCGNDGLSNLIRWGTTTVRLLMNDVSEYRTYLELKKQRFKCNLCQRTFVADTSVVEKHCSISEKVRWSVVTHLKRNTSMTEIARQKNLKVLCFDEFKSVRSVAHAMSFIMMDGKTHQLLDIVENRQLHFLKRYFSRFSRENRGNVRLIVIDMYTPYVSLVKKLFPNAQLIIDRFHVVQYIGRTFRNQRTKVTNRLLQSKEPKQHSIGKQMKRYWKLLQKDKSRLNYEKRLWRPGFKTFLTETEIVDRLLHVSPELQTGYQLYQDLLYAVKKRDQKHFEELLAFDPTLPESYRTTLETFKKFLPQIKNALQYTYSNGPLECLNNHIKFLKRNAYGFRSFYNFKLRIMIRHGNTLIVN